MIKTSYAQPTILIVDDSVENLQLLSNLLKDVYKIKVAKSGEKAIEIAQQHPQPDLILMDIMMPGMGGYECCKVLKENIGTQKIPLIFLTALNEATDETLGFKFGGADFITKPYNPDVVIARINTQLELQRERQKSEELLKILLPEKVISDLINKGKHVPEIHKNVSILFCDFVDFTKISSMLSPETLIDELSTIFGEFDEICKKHHTTRIKTIGDAYMAVSGMNEDDGNHADHLLQCGIAFIRFLNERNMHNTQKWRCRIGIHSGSVIGGIVGKTRFVYDIMGDSVNIAARVETNGQAMMVAITDATHAQLKEDYNIKSLGAINLKGKGETNLYLVNPMLMESIELQSNE
jgi:class 3 adenylate cyclase